MRVCVAVGYVIQRISRSGQKVRLEARSVGARVPKHQSFCCATQITALRQQQYEQSSIDSLMISCYLDFPHGYSTHHTFFFSSSALSILDPLPRTIDPFTFTLTMYRCLSMSLFGIVSLTVYMHIICHDGRAVSEWPLNHHYRNPGLTLFYSYFRDRC